MVRVIALQWLLSWCVVAQAAETPKAVELEGDREVAEAILKLIPPAAGMARAEFLKIAQSGVVRQDEFPNQSLTFVFLSSDLTKKGIGEHIRPVKAEGLSNPATLAEEITRSRQLGPVAALVPYATIVHGDRITKLSCKVTDEAATGTVWFRIPDLFEGDFDFVARRVEGIWRIDEFRLPRAGLRLVRGEQGLWKRQELKPE